MQYGDALLGSPSSLVAVRDYVAAQLETFPRALRKLNPAKPYQATVADALLPAPLRWMFVPDTVSPVMKKTFKFLLVCLLCLGLIVGLVFIIQRLQR